MGNSTSLFLALVGEAGAEVAQEAAHSVPGWQTALFAVLLGAMILCLALEEKLHAKKSVIVGVFAVVCLLLGEVFGLVHRQPVTLLGHQVDLPVYIPGIGWG